jgi:hypothetical protein
MHNEMKWVHFHWSYFTVLRPSEEIQWMGETIAFRLPTLPANIFPATPCQPSKALVHNKGYHNIPVTTDGEANQPEEHGERVDPWDFSVVIVYVCEVCPFEIHAHGKEQFVVWNPVPTCTEFACCFCPRSQYEFS